MQVYAKLEWRPFLIIFALRRFKVERIVLCACEVVAPKVDAPLSEVKQHMGFECAVEVLTCGVFFVPINAAKAIALNADNDVFQQIVVVGHNVVVCCEKGVVLGYEGNDVAGVVGCSVVVIIKLRMCVTVVGVPCQAVLQ